MSKLITVVIILAILVFLIEFFNAKNKQNKNQKYKYKQKIFFMSRAEHECYNALLVAVGDKYYVFPQVHLTSIIDNKVIGQSWNGSFRHINQKSVDFVLCDKKYISPKLAIELDDKTHLKKDRVERDREVERILDEAGLPLLRIENHGHFNSGELSEKINTLLGNDEK
jgi:very-short-patch-repair endonuclease